MFKQRLKNALSTCPLRGSVIFTSTKYTRHRLLGVWKAWSSKPFCQCTSDSLTVLSTVTIQTWSPKIFSKRGESGSRPPKFLVSRADHTHLVHQTATKWAWSARVTKFEISHVAIFNERPFKFYTQLNREEYKRFIYTMAHKWAWSGNVTKCVILHLLNYFCNSWR